MNRKIMALAFGALLTAGTVAASAQIVVHVGPPRHERERVPLPPPEHRDWAWHAGYHQWDGHRYVWVPGRYEQPPRPRARWSEGHWVRRGGGYVWVEGRWR